MKATWIARTALLLQFVVLGYLVFIERDETRARLTFAVNSLRLDANGKITSTGPHEEKILRILKTGEKGCSRMQLLFIVVMLLNSVVFGTLSFLTRPRRSLCRAES